MEGKVLAARLIEVWNWLDRALIALSVGSEKRVCVRSPKEQISVRESESPLLLWHSFTPQNRDTKLHACFGNTPESMGRGRKGCVVVGRCLCRNNSLAIQPRRLRAAGTLKVGRYVSQRVDNVFI